jgi:predicted outer membrane repeat protein
MDTKLTRLIAVASSSVLVLTILAAAPAAVRAGTTAYIGDGTGSGECDTPDYLTDGSADDVEFNTAVAAEDGDIENILYVCPGTYDIGANIYVPSHLTIESVAGAAATVLDSDGTSRILQLDGDVIIRGLTFKNGGALVVSGGAILSDNLGDLTVEDSVFINNQGYTGGAIYVNGVIIIRSSTFTGNSALEDGGAVHAADDLELVIDSEFSGNTSGGYGGAIYVDNDVLDMDSDGQSGFINSTFSGNESTGDGGGAIWLDEDLEASAVILGSEFLNNTADGYGGAVRIYDAYGSVSDNTFTGNSAADGGGALHVEGDLDAAMSSNIFEGNEAQDGGAVQIDDDFLISAVITQNTFLNNVGDDGGAIDFDGLVAGTISSNKFIGNYATGDGGAIDADDIVASTVITRNTFLRNTSEDDGGALWLDDATGDESDLAVISGNMFRSNRATGDGGGIYIRFDDTTMAPKFVTRNSFRSNRAGGIGGGIAIMGLFECVPEITTRQAARAFKKNKYTSNRASGSRRSMNVGAVPCVNLGL